MVSGRRDEQGNRANRSNRAIIYTSVNATAELNYLEHEE